MTTAILPMVLTGVIWTVVGILFGRAPMFCSLVLFGRDKRTDGKSVNDATFFRLVFGAFVMIGVGHFLRLIPGYAGFTPETLTWRLPLQAPVGMALPSWRPVQS